jgi:hypothetical protein
MRNYVAGMVTSVEAKGVTKPTKALLLDKAEAIAKFHKFDDMARNIEHVREK